MLLADQTTLWLALGVMAVVLLAIVVFALFKVFFAVVGGDADTIADVEHFIELTEEARQMVPRGLPLFHSESGAATTAALVRFQAKKDEARRALWASRDGVVSTPRQVLTPHRAPARRERNAA